MTMATGIVSDTFLTALPRIAFLEPVRTSTDTRVASARYHRVKLGNGCCRLLNQSAIQRRETCRSLRLYRNRQPLAPQISPVPGHFAVPPPPHSHPRPLGPAPSTAPAANHAGARSLRNKTAPFLAITAHTPAPRSLHTPRRNKENTVHHDFDRSPPLCVLVWPYESRAEDGSGRLPEPPARSDLRHRFLGPWSAVRHAATPVHGTGWTCTCASDRESPQASPASVR
jgi:hypothetical protein